MRWDRLEDAFEAGLSVSLIATPRDHLLTCEPDERIEEVNGRAEQRFDNIPVVADGAIVGTLTRDRMRAGRRVSDCYTPLSERHMIGATSPILAFVRCPDCTNGRFIVDGERITGLVTLSDLQKLPARAALFGLVTRLELLMGAVIVARFGEDGWINRLRNGDRQTVEEEIGRARQRDTFTRTIDYTQLSHKFWLLRDLRGLDDQRAFRAVRGLRNDLAHAKPYVLDRQGELQLVDTVRIIDDWTRRLRDIAAPAEQDAQAPEAGAKSCAAA